MRCIFCKEDSSNSKTVEHIIPESLGNTEHILTLGVVCDRCNNYFARKIEKPILDSPYFRISRFRNEVANKKGRIPTITGTHVQSKITVEVVKDKDGLSVYTANDRDNSEFVQNVLSSERGSFILPMSTSEKIDSRLM